jgi:hypothetical protein
MGKLRVLGWAALVCCAMGCGRQRVYRPTTPVDAAGAPQVEVVHLKDGGEVRGLIMERSPQTGIVIKLYDNSVRSIPPAAIEYAGRPGTGGLRVDAPEPGTVALDGQEVGRVPLDLNNLEAGSHRLRIKFDPGDETHAGVEVQAGRVTPVGLQLPEGRALADLYRGTHFALGGGPMAGSSLHTSAVLGGVVFAGASIGVSSQGELRLLGHLGLGSDLDYERVWYELAASATYRLRLSALYAIEFGARLSLLPYPDDKYGNDPNYNVTRENSITPAIGVQGSLLTLSFGPARSYELQLWHTLQISPGEATFRTGLSFARTWL